MNARDRLMRFKLGKRTADEARALRAVILTASNEVPYYRDAWRAAGADPMLVRRPADLVRLSVTTKGALLARPGAALRGGRSPRAGIRLNTSGSSGVPITVEMSRGEAIYRSLLYYRALRRNGRLSLPLTIADVGPIPDDEGRGWPERAGLVRLVRLPATMPIGEQVERLRGIRPGLIEGYPTCLDLLAEALVEQGITSIRPRLVVARGEVLHDEIRKRLSRVFSCRVADYYNSEEVGNVAWECPEDPDRRHMNRDACVVEIVDPEGAPVEEGVEGRVLVTNLYNLTMPFIRYDLGDRAAWIAGGGSGRCPCGSTAPSLSPIRGRDDDYLRLPDGRRISPRAAGTLVPKRPSGGYIAGLRRFQVIQASPSDVRVKVVLDVEHDADFRRVIVENITRLHPRLRCEVERVDAIPVDASGKFKKLISHVAAGAGEVG